MDRIVLGFAFLLFSFGLIMGQSIPTDLLNTANDAYQANQYKKAIEKYEALLKEGFSASTVHYNLGNAYYRNDQLGQAILNYERALIIDPGNEDVKHNLDVANSKLTDDIELVSEFFLYKWWHQLRSWMSSEGWSLLALILLWAGVGGFILWLLAPTRMQKKRGFIAGGVLVLCSILPFSLATSRKSYEANSGQAIILQNEVVLRSAPDDASTAIITLHEGTKVGLLDSIGAWKKVRLQDGEIGWLGINSIEQI